MLTCVYFLEWDFVAINVGYGSAGFFFNETGLQYDQDSTGFLGWLGEFSFTPSPLSPILARPISLLKTSG